MPRVDALKTRLAPLARCGASSFFAVAIEFGVLTLLVSVLHVHYLVASILAAGAYLLVNFLLNRRWAFRATGAPVRAQLARHAVVAIVGSAVIVGLVWLFVGGLGLPYQLGWLVAGLLAFAGWTYPMSRFFTFRAAPPGTPAFAVE